MNALGVAGAAASVGVDAAAVVAGLAGFGGVGRRLERKGEAAGVVVYDDYGHHPTAIRETLAAVRQREPGRRVWAVYEPLTYHRTAALLDGFADALARADAVAIADIWAGRDPDTSVSSAAGLAEAVSRREPSIPVAAPGSVEATAAWLAGEVRAGDVGPGHGRRPLVPDRRAPARAPGGPMTVSYPQGYDLLEAFMKARKRYDGDAFVDLFAEDAQLVLDPFTPPLAGHNAVRAYLLEAADAERHYDLAIERHWVSGDTVLAAWHASWNRRTDEATVRQAGFLAAEVGGDGRIVRLRLWTVTREHLAG